MVAFIVSPIRACSSPPGNRSTGTCDRRALLSTVGLAVGGLFASRAANAFELPKLPSVGLPSLGLPEVPKLGVPGVLKGVNAPVKDKNAPMTGDLSSMEERLARRSKAQRADHCWLFLKFT